MQDNALTSLGRKKASSYSQGTKCSIKQHSPFLRRNLHEDKDIKKQFAQKLQYYSRKWCIILHNTLLSSHQASVSKYTVSNCKGFLK